MFAYKKITLRYHTFALGERKTATGLYGSNYRDRQSPIYAILWLHITQELHHLNWNWLCEVELVLKHRRIRRGSRDLVGNNNSIKE